MDNCANFLEYAGDKCGFDVGFGKMFLIYKDRKVLKTANLTAEAINADVESGDIIGIIRGWHTVAGAPVAEVNSERPATGEMTLVRPEILADTLTFENSIAKNEVIGDAVKAGMLSGVLIDDLGNVVGEYNQQANSIVPMKLNFTGKATSDFQYNQTAEKTVAVSVRYFVENVTVLQAGTETELINVKSLVSGALVNISMYTATEKMFKLLLIDKNTGKPYTVPGDITDADVTISGISGDGVPQILILNTDGSFDIHLTGTTMTTTGNETLFITISSAGFYMKETKIVLVKP